MSDSENVHKSLEKQTGAHNHDEDNTEETDQQGDAEVSEIMPVIDNSAADTNILNAEFNRNSRRVKSSERIRNANSVNKMKGRFNKTKGSFGNNNKRNTDYYRYSRNSRINANSNAVSGLNSARSNNNRNKQPKNSSKMKRSSIKNSRARNTRYNSKSILISRSISKERQSKNKLKLRGDSKSNSKARSFRTKNTTRSASKSKTRASKSKNNNNNKIAIRKSLTKQINKSNKGHLVNKKANKISKSRGNKNSSSSSGKGINSKLWNNNRKINTCKYEITSRIGNIGKNGNNSGIRRSETKSLKIGNNSGTRRNEIKLTANVKKVTGKYVKQLSNSSQNNNIRSINRINYISSSTAEKANNVSRNNNSLFPAKMTMEVDNYVPTTSSCVALSQQYHSMKKQRILVNKDGQTIKRPGNSWIEYVKVNVDMSYNPTSQVKQLAQSWAIESDDVKEHFSKIALQKMENYKLQKEEIAKNHLKKPVTGYNKFVQRFIELNNSSNLNSLPPRGIIAYAAEEWQNLSGNEKQAWKLSCEEDTMKYNAEKLKRQTIAAADENRSEDESVNNTDSDSVTESEIEEYSESGTGSGNKTGSGSEIENEIEGEKEQTTNISSEILSKDIDIESINDTNTKKLNLVNKSLLEASADKALSKCTASLLNGNVKSCLDKRIGKKADRCDNESRANRNNVLRKSNNKYVENAKVRSISILKNNRILCMNNNNNSILVTRPNKSIDYNNHGRLTAGKIGVLGAIKNIKNKSYLTATKRKMQPSSSSYSRNVNSKKLKLGVNAFRSKCKARTKARCSGTKIARAVTSIKMKGKKTLSMFVGKPTRKATAASIAIKPKRLSVLKGTSQPAKYTKVAMMSTTRKNLKSSKVTASRSVSAKNRSNRILIRGPALQTRRRSRSSNWNNNNNINYDYDHIHNSNNYNNKIIDNFNKHRNDGQAAAINIRESKEKLTKNFFTNCKDKNLIAITNDHKIKASSIMKDSAYKRNRFFSEASNSRLRSAAKRTGQAASALHGNKSSTKMVTNKKIVASRGKPANSRSVDNKTAATKSRGRPANNCRPFSKKTAATKSKGKSANSRAASKIIRANGSKQTSTKLKLTMNSRNKSQSNNAKNSKSNKKANNSAKNSGNATVSIKKAKKGDKEEKDSKTNSKNSKVTVPPSPKSATQSAATQMLNLSSNNNKSAKNSNKSGLTAMPSD